MSDRASEVQIDPDRVDRVADDVDRHRRRVAEICGHLADLGRQFHLVAEVAQPVGLCGEVSDELVATRTVLRQRAAMAVAADTTTTAPNTTGAQYAWAVRRLLHALGDGEGATGDGDDHRRLLAQSVLGPGLVTLDDELDRQVLAAAPRDVLRRYWATLDLDARDRAVEHSTVEVSDAYLRGDIALDEGQLVVLQGRPVPLDGRHPSTGEGTDWAGFDIPVVPPGWPDGEPPRSLLGGSVVCSLIQGFSVIPSPAPTEPTDVAATSFGLAAQIRGNVSDPAHAMLFGARKVPTLTLITTVLDVMLCRIGLGSGARISTNVVANDDGELVYESSRTDHKYDINGVPLAPELAQRDEQMWNHEHSNELGYVTEPYPGFPAYEVNDLGAGEDG